MTVKELKDKLSDYPDEMIIVASGYEDGYDEVYETKIIKVRKRKLNAWWEGRYTEELIDGEQIDVLYLKSRINDID